MTSASARCGPRYQPRFTESRFCASCHEYNNPDTGAPGQNTYTEWLASPYAQAGPDFRACQDCHMPAATEPGPISSLGGQPIREPEPARSHRFTGATPTTLSDAIELDLTATQDGPELVRHCPGHQRRCRPLIPDRHLHSQRPACHRSQPRWTGAGPEQWRRHPLLRQRLRRNRPG